MDDFDDPTHKSGYDPRFDSGLDTDYDDPSELDNDAVDPEAVERAALSAAAIEEIAKAFAGVDMASMPQVPRTAPCRLPDADPDDWHPPFKSADLIGLDHPGIIDEVATWLCEDCPVLTECGDWALDNPNQEGILGGMTHTRRLKILKGKATRP